MTFLNRMVAMVADVRRKSTSFNRNLARTVTVQDYVNSARFAV